MEIVTRCILQHHNTTTVLEFNLGSIGAACSLSDPQGRGPTLLQWRMSPAPSFEDVDHAHLLQDVAVLGTGTSCQGI